MKNERLLWPDFIRAFAIVLVVVVHTSAPVVISIHDVSTERWMFANAMDSLARVSVPLFFMISGFLVLRKEITVKSSFLRAVRRVLLPLLFWSFFYISYYAYYNGFDFLTRYDYFGLFKTPAQYHLWFLYDLIFLYMIAPFIKAIIDRQLGWYFIVFWILYEVVNFFSLNIFWRFEPLSKHAGYMLAGYYIGMMPKIKNTHRLFLFSLFMLAYFFTVFKTYEVSFLMGSLNQKYYAYRSINVIVMAVSLFMFMKDIHIKSIIFKKIISVVSASALGIYGIHVLVIDLLGRGVFGFNISAMAFDGSVYGLLVTVVSVFLLSFFLVYLLRLIKPIRPVIE